MIDVMYKYLLIFLLLMLPVPASTKDHLTFRSGTADEYLKIDYAIDCTTKTHDVYLIFKYTNISDKLIGFDNQDLGLSKIYSPTLHLVPVDKKDVFDTRGFRIGRSGPSLVSPSDNNLDYYLNTSKSFFVRYPVSRYYFLDLSTSYNAEYNFSFSIKNIRTNWIGSFSFLFDFSCLNNNTIIWHHVKKTEGLYIKPKSGGFQKKQKHKNRTKQTTRTYTR